jgi:hypothetical protein
MGDSRFGLPIKLSLDKLMPGITRGAASCEIVRDTGGAVFEGGGGACCGSRELVRDMDMASEGERNKEGEGWVGGERGT